MAHFEDSERNFKQKDPNTMDREELQNLDNFYVYADTNKPYEPLVQPFSYFYLAVQGQIEDGFFSDLDGISIKYAIVAGDDWELATGGLKGQGQFAFKGDARMATGKRPITWNLPFEAQFRSMTPAGWPRIVLYAISKSSDGQE